MKESGISYLKRAEFRTKIDGLDVDLFVLENNNGYVAEFTNYGGRLLSLWVPDKDGAFEDIILGPSCIQDAQKEGFQYFGAIIGRYCNRIKRGKFMLNGIPFELSINDKKNHLHGGKKGFNNVVWTVDYKDKQNLRLSYVSKEGEEGYPGRLEVKANFSLTDKNELQIQFRASTNTSTIVNLTYHPFFNLKGCESEDLNSHFIQTNASRYIPIDNESIPIGSIDSVKGTPFDFGQFSSLKDMIDIRHIQMKRGNGFDHSLVLDGTDNEYKKALTVFESHSGRTMELFTNQLAVQFYSGNFLNGTTKGKRQSIYVKRSALCVEPQGFPDAPNHVDFPSMVLDPDKEYCSMITYKFSTSL